MKDFKIVLRVGDYRFISYTVDGELIWAIQERGLFRFWRWTTFTRWKLVDSQTVLLDENHKPLPTKPVKACSCGKLPIN